MLSILSASWDSHDTCDWWTELTLISDWSIILVPAVARVCPVSDRGQHCQDGSPLSRARCTATGCNRRNRKFSPPTMKSWRYEAWRTAERVSKLEIVPIGQWTCYSTLSEHPVAMTRVKVLRYSGSMSSICSTDSCLVSPLTSWFISASNLSTNQKSACIVSTNQKSAFIESTNQ